MVSNSTIIDLKNFFLEDTWPLVIPAIRQDSLVWDALQNPDFRGAAKKNLGTIPEDWSPANLALISLGYKLRANDVRDNPNSIPVELNDNAETAYYDYDSGQDMQPNLDNAGLLAIALSQKPQDWAIDNNSTLIKTTLTCLFAFVPDAIKLLHQLPMKTVLHVILANPLMELDQLDLLEKRLMAATAEERLASLNQLLEQNPYLATTLTERLSAILNIPAKFTKRSSSNSKIEGVTSKLQSPIAKLQSLLHQADYQRLAASPDDAREALSSAQKAASQIQSTIALQSAQTAIQTGKPQEAIALWGEFAADSQPEQTAILALSLMDHGYFDEADLLAQSISTDENAPPLSLLATARLAVHHGELNKARLAARQALTIYQAEPDNLPEDSSLVDLLLSLSLTEEAKTLAEAQLEKYPNNPQVAHLLAKACIQVGDPENALSYAHLAVVLNPNNIDLHRSLADTLETNQVWLQALDERETIIAMDTQVKLDDLQALAACAYKAKQFERTAEVSRKIIQANVFDGPAHALLGKSLIELKQPEEGLQKIEKAIQLSPDLPDAWLTLADAQHNSGQQDDAGKTLIKASRAAPESPEIQLALGDHYQSGNTPSKALKAYQKAHELVTSNWDDTSPSLRAEITCALGESLLQLGHIERAKELLAEAYQHHSGNARIAHAYARTLIKHEQLEEALIPLTDALQNDPENVDIKLDYAQTQLTTHKNLDLAEKALEDVVRKEPEHGLAKALLAETLELIDNKQGALEMYHRALSSKLKEDYTWHKRLSLGLSRLALALHKPETALAAMESVWQKNPEDFDVAKTLTYICRQNQLPEKALQTASTALQSHISDVDAVYWFVDQALALDRPKEALAVLEKAAILHSHEPRLQIQLGEIQQQLGNQEEALKSFDLVSTMEEANLQDLADAANGLVALEDAEKAIHSLERAVTMSKSKQHTSGDPEKDQETLANLLSRLADTQESNQDYQAALDTVEEVITIKASNANLDQKKGDLLLKLGQIERAAAWIEAALEASPDDTGLSLQAAHIQRKLGNLPKAINHAKESLNTATPQEKLPALIMAAQLAFSVLQYDATKQILSQVTPEIQNNASQSDPESLLKFYCLSSELALEGNEEIAAANSLTKAIEISAQHVRVLALQTRMYLRQGGLDQATQILEAALKALGAEEEGNEVESYLGLALAAIECHSWSPAVFLLKEAIKTAPKEPRPYAELARVLVLRAEYQHLYQAVKIQNPSLGEAVISENAYQNFENAMMTATQYMEDLRAIIQQPAHLQSMLSHLLSRGQAAFRPSKAHAEALTELPAIHDNQAAYLAALRHSEEFEAAAKLAVDLYQAEDGDEIKNPLLLGQIALASIDEAPSLAVQAAQKALDQASRANLPEVVIFYGLNALVALKVLDKDAQISAIQSLLAVWDQEAHWYSLVAELLLDQEHESSQADQGPVEYLEKAVQLEPHKALHYYKLGQAYTANDNPQAAIEALKRATNLAPEDDRPWADLAKIFQADDERQQAVNCAKQAIQLNEQNADAHIILAELNLENGSPDHALTHISDALAINPRNMDAQLLQAETLSALNKPADALAALEAATTRMLPTTDLLLRTIALKRQVHGKKAALEALKNLASQYPDDPEIAIALAKALAENNQKKQAIQLAQDALSKEFENFTANQRGHLHQLLGHLLRKSGQLDQAVQHLSTAIELLPGWEDPYIDLGRTYHARRQYELAMQTFQQAIDIAPGDSRPYHWAGLTLKDSKDYLNAEKMLRRAAGLAPDDVSIHRKLGTVVALNLVHNPSRNGKNSAKNSSHQENRHE